MSLTTTVKQPITSSETLHALLEPAEARRMKRALTKPTIKPTIPVRSVTAAPKARKPAADSPVKSVEEKSPSESSFSDELRDDELYAAAEALEFSLLSGKYINLFLASYDTIHSSSF
ncbi:MAG: hypothetical protein AB2693_31355 [Candidatus Thiodiazotropha sp.]